MIYIASPFFNDKQQDFVKNIEDYLAAHKVDYYSPRSEGILLDLTEEERQKQKKHIYDINVERICECDHLVAVIDDRDIGTIWEMGYATALGTPVTSISNEDYGLNVMLAESVKAHVLSIPDLYHSIITPDYSGEIVRQVY